VRDLTRRERRTVRIGAIVLVAYLGIFYGMKGWHWLEDRRDAHDELRIQAAEISAGILRERARARRMRELEIALGFDPRATGGEKIVQAARADLEKLAVAQKVQVGTLRELEGHSRQGESRRFQVSGTGLMIAVAGFVDGLRALGHPIVVDRLAIDTSGLAGGVVRFTLDLVLADFDEWKRTRRSDRA